MSYQRLKSAAYYAAFVFFISVPTVLVVYLALTKEYIPIDKLSHIRFFILILFVPIVLKYVIHLLIAPWFPVVESLRSKKRSVSHAPSVSVMIAAWNEEVGIRAALESIVKTHYPNLEIIVINDGSHDRTHEVVASFISEHRERGSTPSPKFAYQRVENGGKARALNAALSLANGEIVITIDADSIMDRNTIRNMVKHFADPGVASVAGNVVIGNRRRPLGLIQQLEYLYGFYFKRADSLLNSVYIVGGAAAAYRRDVIVRLGGFDEQMLTEDIELSTRLQDHGYRIRYAANAIVYTEGPSDVRGLCRQRLRWKYGRLLTFFKYRHLFFSLDRRHNPYLTFVVLPMALFAEILLFFEYALLAVFFIYTFSANDFKPLVFVVLLITAVVGLQIFSDSIARYHRNLLLLAPGAWIIFYIMDFIEFQALMRSIWRLVTRRAVSWQRWSRVGVFGGKAE